MKKNMFVLIVFLTGSLHSYFEMYQMQKAYNQGDMKQAQYILDDMLTQQPDNVEVAYNLGKISLKEKEYNKADAYFNHVIQAKSAPTLLREQAWYDLGLTHVYRQQWQDALASFEEVLKINPKNEHAQKMIDQIKKILEEKNKQEQQDQQSNDSQSNEKLNDQQNNETDQNKNNDKKNDDEAKHDEDNNSQNNEPQNEKNKDTNQESPKKKSGQNDEHNDQQEANSRADQQQENNPKENEQDSDESSHNQSPGQSSDMKDHQEPTKDIQPSQHNQQNDLQGVKNDGKNDTQIQQQPADKETMLLQLVENQDAQMSKALFKRQIQQQMPSRYGQKNW